MDAARRGRGDAAQEEVDRPAQLPRRVVGRPQPAAQQAMQRQQVERGLQLVAVRQHRGLQCVGGVGGIVLPQCVGLVVQHPPAAVVLEHQVGKTHQQPVQPTRCQRRPGAPGQQVLPAEGVQPAAVQRFGGHPELHLRQPRRQHPQRGTQRRQRGVQQALQPLQDVVGPFAAEAGPLAAPSQQAAQGRIGRVTQFGKRTATGLTLLRQPLQLVVQEVAGQRPLGKTVPGRLHAFVRRCRGGGRPIHRGRIPDRRRLVGGRRGAAQLFAPAFHPQGIPLPLRRQAGARRLDDRRVGGGIGGSIAERIGRQGGGPIRRLGRVGTGLHRHRRFGRGQVPHQRREAAHSPVPLDRVVKLAQRQQRRRGRRPLPAPPGGQFVETLQPGTGIGLRPGGQQRFGLRRIQRPAGRQQVAQRAPVQVVGTGLVGPGAAAGQAHPQPQRMAGPGERHVEQAQLLAQALRIGQRHIGIREAEVQPPPRGATGLVGVVGVADLAGHLHRQLQHLAATPVHHPRRLRKGQKDQRVLQPLGLVHRDHLHQLGITFQADDALLRPMRLGLDLLGQPADQRLLPLQRRRRGLQQLGQVQPIGEAALTGTGVLFLAMIQALHRVVAGPAHIPTCPARMGQPGRRQVQRVQRLQQHGQHPLALPHRTQAQQQALALLPAVLVVAQGAQFGPTQPQGGGGIGRTHEGGVQRVGHRLQPTQQVHGLRAAQHRILVRQVHRRHAAAAELAADGFGLPAVAHQHRAVGGAQAAPTAVVPDKTGLRVIEQGDDLRRSEPRLAAAQRFGRQRLRQPLQGERRQRLNLPGRIPRHQPLTPAARSHRLERQRMPTCARQRQGAPILPDGLGELLSRRRAEQRLHPRPAGLCLLEHPVHRCHQRLGGAEVGAQHMVAPGGGLAGGEVAVDVRTAEAVDRLFRVADQQQQGLPRIGSHVVEPVEQPVLQRRGVLELVDQRRRVLADDAFAQPRPRRAGQRRIQPGLQVGKTELRRAALEQRQLPVDAGRGVAQQGFPGRHQCGQGVEELLQRVELRGQIGQAAALGQGIGQALGRQPPPAGLELGLDLLRVRRPLQQCITPGIKKRGAQLDAVEQLASTLRRQPGPQRLGPLGPADLDLRQALLPLTLPLLQPVAQHQGLATEGAEGLAAAQQALQLRRQAAHLRPDLQHGIERRTPQRVDLTAPVVVHRLALQRQFVGHQLLIETLAAVEGMLQQHALAPGVDGVHRGIVHRLGGQRQPVRRGQAAARCTGRQRGRLPRHTLRPGRQQGLQKAIPGRRFGLPAEAARGLHQAGPDAFGQFPGGGAGEGHHQDLTRRQRPRRAVVRITMAQHQAQVKRGNRPGLAGAGTGLDQPGAGQGQRERVEGLRGRGCHASSSQGPSSEPSSSSGAAPSSHWARTDWFTQAYSGA